MKWKIVLINVLSILLLLFLAGSSKGEMLGIDVSRWQGQIDWDSVKDHASFAIIKAGGSDNGLYEDREFSRNRDEARRLGMSRGYYYYAGGGNPVQEAEHFAGIMGDLQPGEVVALDFEINHPDPVGYSLKFLVRTEELLGVKPLLYTNMNRVWTNDWQPVVSNGNQLWGAIFDGSPTPLPSPGSWPAVTIKQYTSKATIPGITVNTVDMNYFERGSEEFQALGRLNPVADINLGLGLPNQVVGDINFDKERPNPVVPDANSVTERPDMVVPDVKFDNGQLSLVPANLLPASAVPDINFGLQDVTKSMFPGDNKQDYISESVVKTEA